MSKDEVVIEIEDTTSQETKDEKKEKEKEQDIEELVKQVNNCITCIKEELVKVQQKVKNIEKLEKQNKKKNKAVLSKPSKRQPSGFAIPSVISEELCEFMKEKSGTKVARTDVTKFLVKYVKDNSLQDPNNGRIILPDTKLKGILSCKNNEQITYFNLQTFINHHFKDK